MISKIIFLIFISYYYTSVNGQCRVPGADESCDLPAPSVCTKCLTIPANLCNKKRDLESNNTNRKRRAGCELCTECTTPCLLTCGTGSPNSGCTGCDCTGGWSGPNCEICRLGSCSGHGLLNTECTECDCDGGWKGNECQTCRLGSCSGHGTIDSRCTGCNCNGGWTGRLCENCPVSCVHGSHNSDCTSCNCNGGWLGNECETCNYNCNGGTVNSNCNGCSSCLGSFTTASNCLSCSLNCGTHGSPNSECTACVCDGGWQGTICDVCNQNCGGGVVNPTCDGCTSCSGFYTEASDCTQCGLNCQNSGSANAECTSCNCNGGWSGSTCQTCNYQCNGGTVNSGCNGCSSCTGFFTTASNCLACSLDCGNGDSNSDCTTCNCDENWIGSACDTCNYNCNGGTANTNCNGCSACLGSLTVDSDCSVCGLNCNNGNPNDGCNECECSNSNWVVSSNCSICGLNCGIYGQPNNDCNGCNCNSNRVGETCDTCKDCEVGQTQNEDCDCIDIETSETTNDRTTNHQTTSDKTTSDRTTNDKTSNDRTTIDTNSNDMTSNDQSLVDISQDSTTTSKVDHSKDATEETVVDKITKTSSQKTTVDNCKDIQFEFTSQISNYVLEIGIDNLPCFAFLTAFLNNVEVHCETEQQKFSLFCKIPSNFTNNESLTINLFFEESSIQINDAVLLKIKNDPDSSVPKTVTIYDNITDIEVFEILPNSEVSIINGFITSNTSIVEISSSSNIYIGGFTVLSGELEVILDSGYIPDDNTTLAGIVNWEEGKRQGRFDTVKVKTDTGCNIVGDQVYYTSRLDILMSVPDRYECVPVSSSVLFYPGFYLTVLVIYIICLQKY